jgi:hypothetical protein
VITATGGGVRQCDGMVLAGQHIKQPLVEGPLRCLHQSAEHLEHGVPAMMITS